jgi:hypothetical protein
VIEMTQYPHEWVWSKVEPHKETIFILSFGSVLSLVLCYVAIRAALVFSASDASSPVNYIHQPSAFSYNPIIALAFVILLLFGIVIYHYLSSDGCDEK